MKPGEKADLIRMLQEKGHIVLMTGDRLNDAGALMPVSSVSSVSIVAFATFVTRAAGRFTHR
jgi:P-type E1-E2 ATPase